MPLTSPAELLAVGLSADRTIAVSPAVARALRRRLYPAGRLRVVTNGIDFARVDTPPSEDDMAAARAALGDLAGRPVVLVLARRKDQHVLLRGLAGLERPVVVACVGIEGDSELRAIERTLPAHHRVVYVPFTDRPLAFCRLAGVSALPSRIEGLSIALLETMALGLPVVASDAGGNPDLITAGDTGLLVAPLDPDAWARALARVLGDREFAARIARRGRELVRREFTLEGTAERTEAVYREALERRRALDGDRATGETYCLAHHVYSADGERKLMIAALRYQDTFVKADGTWRFAERRLYVRWIETRTLEPAAVADRSGTVTFGVEPTGRYGGIGVATADAIE